MAKSIGCQPIMSGVARWESEIGRMRMQRQRARVGKSAMSFRGANGGLRRMTREITSERSARKRRGWPSLRREYDASNWTIIGGFNDGKVLTAPVGSFPPNGFGIYDLGGNVWEWCQDKYEPGSASRVLRGGSWLDDGRDYVLSSFRGDRDPDDRSGSIGFRAWWRLVRGAKCQCMVPFVLLPSYPLHFGGVSEKFMNLASFWHGLAREFRLGARGAWRQESASRVLRGGSWNNNDRDNVLSSNRNNNDPDNRNENIGFRAVVEAGFEAQGGQCTKHRRDLAWLKGCASGAKKHLIRQAPPWRKSCGSETREKTLQAGWPGEARLSRLFLFDALEPAAGHTPGIVNPAHHMKKLFPADPDSLMNDAPEDAQFFKTKIQSCE